MDSEETKDITQLLESWGKGDEKAFAELWPMIEGRLRKIAHGYMRREQSDHTLETSALINEAYIQLVNEAQAGWQSRAHFFGMAATIMRHFLVNYAKAKRALKRGGNDSHVSLDDANGLFLESAIRRFEERKLDLLALHDALNRLRELDPQQVHIVELRFFAGLTIKETAEVLNSSTTQINREWAIARTWLYRELNRGV